MKKLYYRNNDMLFFDRHLLNVNDVISIGKYNWRVLDIYDHQALLISDCIIDERRIDGNGQNLNDWLKNGFIDYAFSWDFVPLISSEMFLLSKEMLEKYFDCFKMNNNRGYASSYWLSDICDHKASYVDSLGIIRDHASLSEIKGVVLCFYMHINQAIDIKPVLDDYKRKCALQRISSPFIGMDEKDIEYTRCGVYYSASLFNNSHSYRWVNENNQGFLQVICKNHKVKEVLRMYDDCWNDDEPLFVGIAHKLLKEKNNGII